MKNLVIELGDERNTFENKNIFNFLAIDSYKNSLAWLINFFNILIIVSIFLFNYLLINSLFNNINDIYFNKNIIEPISNEYEILVQDIAIRLKALDDIFLESKQENLRIISDYIFNEENLECINSFLNLIFDPENVNKICI